MKNKYRKYRTKINLTTGEVKFGNFTYGDGTGIYYKGKAVEMNTPITTKTVYFQHIYWCMPQLPDQEMRRGKHACLENGYWCWSNFFENPLDIFKYHKRK